MIKNTGCNGVILGVVRITNYRRFEEVSEVSYRAIETTTILTLATVIVASESRLNSHISAHTAVARTPPACTHETVRISRGARWGAEGGLAKIALD